MNSLPAYCLCLALFAVGARADSPPPGSQLPREQAVAAKRALEAAREGLRAKDLAAVKAACARAAEALGPWAGRPDQPTPHYLPMQAEPFSGRALEKSWLADLDHARHGAMWVKNAAGDPREMETGLRMAAVEISAFSRTALLAPAHASELSALAAAGGDWLAQRQTAAGGFPMPIGPGLHPREKVGFILAKLLQEHPEMAVDGWIVDDRGDGGLQYDNGLCGRAQLDLWQLTHGDRYLASARRSADWAAAQPLCPNWNYNAFSVGLLARAFRETADPRFLEAAIEKARIGVLPGQLPGGRWLDGHNANAVYHEILLRDLLELAAALPQGHPFAAELRDSLQRGLDHAADETLAEGYTGSWAPNFAQGLLILGENEKWHRALNVCVNAALSGHARGLGYGALPVLEWVAARSSKPSQ